jgi:hypothetical protein
MTRLEELKNIPKDKLDGLQRGFEKDGGVVSIIPQADGLFTMRAVFSNESSPHSSSEVNTRNRRDQQ